MPIEIDQIDYAWLNLSDEDIKTLANSESQLIHDKNNPGMNELRMMKHSDYFFFTCKTLLNIELLPIQLAILEELWTRPFPMYIASRGFGKAESVNNTILTDNGWVRMGDIKAGDKTYGRDGKLHNVIAIHPQGKKQICRLTLLDGRTIDCCEDHLWVVKRNDGKELTVDTKKIIEKYIYEPESGAKKGPVYKWRIPNCEPIELSKKELPIDPYILGCLLGDGCITTLTPKISTNDIFIVEEFRRKLPEFKIEQDITTNNYTIVDLNKDSTSKLSVLGNEYKSKTNNRLTTKIKALHLNVDCYNKFIPDIYKYSSIEDRMELIRGLIDTDGCVTTSGAIEFTNTCEKLVDDLIDVLRSLGITCTKAIDDRSGQMMTLPQGTVIERTPYFRVFINTSQPIAKLPRKLERIKTNPTNVEKFVAIVKAEYIDEYTEMQCITVDNPDHTYITKDYIVTHNSFLLAVFCWLKMILVPNTKVVVVGAAFRQSKIIFDYMNVIWNNAPILQSIAGDNSGPRVGVDKVTMSFNNSWTIAIPIGDGSTIRGLRAHVIIGDEFASISPDIYETVIQGFTSVSPNPLQNVQVESRKRKMKDLGLWTQEYENIIGAAKVNQSIVSGTADYAFKHFAQYWKRYHTIISSGGDREKLRDIFPDEVPQGFDWRDFSIIRIPYELIPKGFMDEKQVAKAKATIHSGTFNNEYGAVFSEDSDGFFKRSLIESCVVSEKTPINGISFEPRTVGDPDYQYVFGVDPASESDNFTIVIIELHTNHNRVVYCWSTNRKEFKKKLVAGRAKEHDFYGFINRKIRNLMRVFPCVKIGLDAQGGGVSVEEALQDPDKMLPHENAIYREVNVDKPYYTDTMMGSHILELVQFANYEWTYNANHNLKKDMEEKFILLPALNPVLLAIEASKQELTENHLEYDSFEDCSIEIEYLKDELCTIVHSMTGNGQGARERWDTPEIKLEGSKKGRQRKDRYSAFLIANSIARQIHRAIAPASFQIIGDYRQDISTQFKNQQMYNGTDIWRNITEDCFIGVQRHIR